MRLLPTSILGRFFLATFLWLPAAFAFWYFVAQVLLMPAVWTTQWLLNLWHPGLIENVEGLARELFFVTGLTIDVPGAPPGAVGQAVISVNALVYSWNLPVVMALLFAADERFFTYWRLVIAYIGLMPLHIWGIGFDVLKTLALESGSEIRHELGFQPWHLEAIGLGYQFGFLMLPVIGAATLWIAMNRRFILILLDRPSFTSLSSRPPRPDKTN